MAVAVAAIAVLPPPPPKSDTRTATWFTPARSAEAGTRAWANAALTVAGKVSGARGAGCAWAKRAPPASRTHTESRQHNGEKLAMGPIIRAPPG